MAKTASLTAGLVAKKGSAAPAHLAELATPEVVSPAPLKKAVDYYKALTVKLDKKSQEIFVAALDMWLAAQGEKA